MVREPGQAEEKGIRIGEEALLSAALAQVHELNERCLVLLQKLANGPDGLPPSLAALSPVLEKLVPAAIPAIANQPFLFFGLRIWQSKRARPAAGERTRAAAVS